MSETRSEVDAVAERYGRRDVGDLYSMLRPEVLLAFQERQRELVGLLRRRAPARPADLRLLEVGCGMGGNLLELLQLGFSPANLTGSELLSQRARQARSVLPDAVTIHEGDATALSFEPATFDVVYVSLVFSSLLSDEFQERLARCMWSWVRPGGGVLWYDFVYDNPANRDVRGVSLQRVRALFPGAEVVARRVTLAPPISRRVCRVHPSAYRVLNLLPLLRTHILCWIGKRATDPDV